MIFIIFHGSFGTPEGNWFPQLKENLEALDQKVLVPRFPVDDWQEITDKGDQVPGRYQNLDNWIEVFEEDILPQIKDDKLTFIGHSLAPVFILHIVEKFQILLDCAIFVSPFMTSLNRKDLWQFDHVNKTFYKDDFDFANLKRLIPLSYVLYSENDPYVDKKYPLEFARKLGSSLIEVKGGGHLNDEFGYTSFPLVFELCKTRFYKQDAEINSA